ncbi:hypothetical protein BDW62DRAFT_208851 [Aspergillus aurantiobrunneus]
MESLPNDIILLVGDCLDSHDDCYNAVFVNRRFHDLFSRALYRSASLNSRSAVQCFAKAIMPRPELTRVVRSLDFGNWQFEQGLPDLNEDDIALFSSWAKTNSNSAEEHSQWEKDLCSGVDEAWIALLLSSVHNVRQLQLTYPSHSLESRGYLDRLFFRAATHQKPFDRHPAFHRLREVSLRQATASQDDKGSFKPSQIMPFLQMPALKTLSVDSLVEYRPEATSEQTSPEETPNLLQKQHANHVLLSEITLTCSNGAQGMKELISSCPSLKSFKYQHSDAQLLAEGFQPSAFSESLSNNKTTLETIWLDNLGEHLPFTFAGLNESHDEWFGSFADFTALKDLRIRLPNLLDIQYQLEPSSPLTEVLPDSIESLYIEGCKENSLDMLIRQVKSVLEARKTRFKALRWLHIEGFFHDDDEDADASSDGANGDGGRVIKPRVYEMVEPLQEACAQAKVQLFLRDRMCLQTMDD